MPVAVKHPVLVHRRSRLGGGHTRLRCEYALEIGGVEITRQSTRRFASRLEKRADPRGRDYYWLTGSAEDAESPGGTDAWAVAQGRISVTPLRLSMTYEELDPVLRSWRLAVPGR